jgi:histone H2B
MSPKVKKARGSKNPDYGSYLLKLFKDTHPGCSIARDSAWVVDGIVGDFQNRLIARALKAALEEGKSTLKGKHVKAAAIALMPGELRNLAIGKGEKALLKYTTSR